MRCRQRTFFPLKKNQFRRTYFTPHPCHITKNRPFLRMWVRCFPSPSLSALRTPLKCEIEGVPKIARRFTQKKHTPNWCVLCHASPARDARFPSVCTRSGGLWPHNCSCSLWSIRAAHDGSDASFYRDAPGRKDLLRHIVVGAVCAAFPYGFTISSSYHILLPCVKRCAHPWNSTLAISSIAFQ